MNFQLIIGLMALAIGISALMFLVADKYQSKFFKFVQLTLFYFGFWPFMLVGGIIFMIFAYIGESRKRRRFEEWEP